MSLLVPTPLLYAQETYADERMETGRSKPEQDVTAEDMLVDLVALRITGFAGMVLGTAAFIVALPFTLITNRVGEAGKKLVVEPAKYTFTRPLGHI